MKTTLQKTGISTSQNEALRAALRRNAKIVSARIDFWSYCRALSPDFYREDVLHLRDMCDSLHKFYKRELINPHTKEPYLKLIIELPPQHGKTRTLVHFVQWVFGQEQRERVICMSYSDDTATDFSKYTRAGIRERANTPDQVVFRDIFPGVMIERGTDTAHKWALQGQHFNYLGAGLRGGITSKGGSILITDDLIKGRKEALNENHLREVWDDYTSTFLSRRASDFEGPPLEIMVGTAWAKNDPIGRLKDADKILRDKPFESYGQNWYVFGRSAYDAESDTMLCSRFLSKREYFEIKALAVEEIFEANYNRKRLDIKGRLYKKLLTYTHRPRDENGKLLFERIANYTDTADQGSDFLCSINYGEYEGQLYILDVYYTQEGMEITEPATAEFLVKSNVRVSDIESNNGGRGFARNVERILREKHGRRDIVVRWFHQSENKRSRIVGYSGSVQKLVLFPVDWRDRWPDFYNSITSFNKDGKNEHDDAEDALTGVVESMGNKFEFLT